MGVEIQMHGRVVGEGHERVLGGQIHGGVDHDAPNVEANHEHSDGVVVADPTLAHLGVLSHEGERDAVGRRTERGVGGDERISDYGRGGERVDATPIAILKGEVVLETIVIGWKGVEVTL